MCLNQNKDTYSIVTSYKFVKILDPIQMQSHLREICDDYQIRGTILVAQEGINFTLSGNITDLEQLLIEVNKIDCFSDLKYNNYTTATFIPFDKMKVRLKNEIVALKQDTLINLDIDRNPAGGYLDCKEWDALIEQDDVIVIDTRNSYEFAYGSFNVKNIINPDTETFADITQWLKDNINMNHKTQKIAMFCTGGIRCEKSTAYVKSLGFKNVYHLRGGILKYLEDTKNRINLWEGNLFVFDNRIALDKNLKSITEV